MINVTDVVIPQPPDVKTFFKRNSKLKFIQRNAPSPSPTSEEVMMWQKMISFIQQSQGGLIICTFHFGKICKVYVLEKELIKYASNSQYGLKSVDIPLQVNQQFTHQVNDGNSKIVLKRGQSFYVDLHFDHDLQTAVDLTINIYNGNTITFTVTVTYSTMKLASFSLCFQKKHRKKLFPCMER